MKGAINSCGLQLLKADDIKCAALRGSGIADRFLVLSIISLACSSGMSIAWAYIGLRWVV
jgi:hypothetical protein